MTNLKQDFIIYINIIFILNNKIVNGTKKIIFYFINKNYSIVNFSQNYILIKRKTKKNKKKEKSKIIKISKLFKKQRAYSALFFI